MTSYMYNPSRKVTDILSKFFEFDPSELELGIWSGDLQLKNVKLRQEAIHPLLNKKANKPHTNPLKKAPLHMKLVSGTVGSMRIRIPWKRLVWGQGAVQLEISDVMIVLALQSREETEEQRRQGLLKVKDKKKKAEEGSGVSKAYREAKQKRLREAEKKHMQGMPVAIYLENLHRKQSVAREAAKAEEAAKKSGSAESSKPKAPGRVDKWLKNTGSDLFWRFFAGIQGSIKKARIVVVQDGVEVGCIVQSIEVVAGKDGTKINVNMGDEDPSEMSEEARTAAEMTPPESFVYEGVYEDGEHVDKTIKQEGFGLFVRKEVSMAKVPQALRFSTSVSADDYILRPVDLDLSFSFFYPYPPERRKKRGIDNQSQGTPTTAASSTGLSGALSVGESTTASSKQRRGKRERDGMTPNLASGATPPATADDFDRRGKLMPTQSLTRNRFIPMTPSESRLRNQHRRLVSDGQQIQGGRPRLQRYPSMRSTRSNSLFSAAPLENMSVQESPTVIQDTGRSMEVSPKFDCRVTLKEIRVVFTTRHYELLNYFLSTVSRMKNGRPDQLIRSTPKETNTAAFQRKFIDATSGSALPMSPRSPVKRPRASEPAKPNATMLSAMLAPLTGFRGGSSDIMELEHDDSGSESKKDNPLHASARRSIRSQVLIKWWKYSIGAILWEVQKRKHLATNFRQMYISFDWNRQRYKRKEYIELYIARKLENRQDSVWPFEDSEKRENELLRIEDELPLEQILLYRSIARSIRVRGMTKMPDSIQELHSAQIMKTAEKRKRRKSGSREDKEDEEAAETNLLSLVQQKFNASSQLRQPGGLFKKFRSSTEEKRSMFPSDFQDGRDYDDDYDAQSSDVVQQPNLPQQGLFTPEISGHDSTINADGDGRTPSFKRSGAKQMRRGSLGNSVPDIHPGNFYSSGGNKRDSQADGRTVRTFQRKDGRGTRLGQTVGSGDDTIGKPDERMKIALSLSIKLFDFMVVEEDYIFDISPDQLKRSGKSEKDSVGGLSREYYSGGEETSSDDVSDLSVLTDDQRFFNDGGQIEPITEEEEEEGGAKMLSTDFLRFGLPEEPLLRLTMNSIGCSVRGRSSGRLNLGLSIRRICALSENEAHVLSMGALEAATPISEVNVNSAVRRKSFDSFDLTDLSTTLLNRQESVMSSKGRGSDSGRAVSLMICSDEAFKDVQCDLSKIAVTLDLVPATKLLHFYSKSEIKFPDRIVEKSSADVARKFMVYKTASQGPVGTLNTAVRVRGLEVRIPFVEEQDDSNSSEASNVDLSNSYDDEGPFIATAPTPRSALIFSCDSLDLFSGAAVDEMSAVTDLTASRSSLFSGSFTSRKTAAIPAKTLEMLDIAELIAGNDSFSCRHVVATMGSINCTFETKARRWTKVVDVPVDVELLITTNETSLLETSLPKTQLVLEISPVHLLLSKERLEMLSSTKSSVDFSTLDTSSKLMKKMRKPDPPRIEILSRRILHSLDLNCRRVQLSIVKDTDQQSETISAKLKEMIMEECLSDFLSIVSCFDLSLPNEEALSSAMQVCIGRLVGLGLSDDEAWGCTNAARLNFLDDVALMRRAQTDALVQISSSMHHPSLLKTPLHEEASGEDETSSSNSSDSVEISLTDTSAGAEDEPSLDTAAPEDESEDDASTNSAHIVDTTLQNAVEKTVATFAPLLQTYRSDFKDLHLNSILTLDLPLGFSMSSVKLFYDSHITFLVTSLVATNSAGVELLTLVPQNTDEEKSLDEDEEATPLQGVCFSRYDLDEDHDFGKGGMPMSALAADDEEGASITRKRSRFDDIEIGEVEVLFSSKVYEGIIDEISKLGHRSQDDDDFPVDRPNVKDAPSPRVEASLVFTAASVSVLFTSDELIPFARLTLERMAYRNSKGLEHSFQEEKPSWLLVAEAAALQNLAPEGQFYPDTLTLISPATGETDFPFQVSYFKGSDPWKQSSRLSIDFKGFRLFLIRQFIHEILQFFVYDKYGVGRLKKKYSKDVRDVNGNPRPPLLWTVSVDDTSIVCPRSSTSSDMAVFEVQKGLIAISYIPESFKMPTETSPFDPAPSGKTCSNQFSNSADRRNSFLSTTSEFHECMDEPFSDSDDNSPGPISSFSAELKKRITVDLAKVQIFTVIASEKAARDAVESPLFRFYHVVNGHAASGKPVYVQKPNIDRQPSVSPESLRAFDKFEQRWEEISTNLLDVEVFADYAPHMRLLIGSRHGPFTLDARMSQLCLLLSVWDNNMQEMPAMFPFFTDQVTKSATPPEIPDSFPAYGTEDFVKHLEDTSSIRSEICCIFKALSLRCTFDPPGYFSVDPECFQYFEDPSCPDDEKPGLVLTLEDANIHVMNDFLNVRRIAIGTSFLELIDERRSKCFQKVLSTSRVERADKKSTTAAWADIGWGLRNDIRTLSSPLPMPVIFTVFMTPGWSLINVGAESANGVMHELSWIWLFLGYFKSYYTDVAFGNPGHQAQQWAHKFKNALRKSKGEKPVDFEPLPGVNVDFRLWVCKPILCIPSDYYSSHAPCLRIESRTGLWYRYKSIQTLSSQEVSTTDLNLYFSNEFQKPEVCRRSDIREGVAGARSLVEGLSFGLRYDSNNLYNHKDVSVLIPFAGEDIPNLSVAGPELEVRPVILPTAIVCKPVQPLSRHLGPKVCEITCIIEVLPITSNTMMNFFKGPVDLNPEFLVPEEGNGPVTYSISAEVHDLRVFTIDPVLGVQLPVAVASIASLHLTATQFTSQPVKLDLEPGESPPDDLQLTLRSHLWADYFKLGMTRSWEPLLEPFDFVLMYEQAKDRGQGYSMEADSPFHVNLSGAFLQILGETIESFSSLVKETFGEKSSAGQALRRSVSLSSPSKDRAGAVLEDAVRTSEGCQVQVFHEIPKPLKSEDRVAFSFRNLTGQKVRVHQQTDRTTESALGKPAIVTYLNQNETMGLTFAATISVIKNLSVVEVPYPGLPNSPGSHQNHGSLKHAVDLQVPGFRWVQGIKVDTFGRRFEMLIPRSIQVHAKMLRDWRLKNAMMVLTEVGLDSGGRLVTVRSLFEIRNSTTHPIKVVYNPDPRRRPVEELEDHLPEHIQDADTAIASSVVSQQFVARTEEIKIIQPGSTFQIPTLLLERSLQMTGSHLGCLWLCPDTQDKSMPFWNFFRSNGSAEEEDLEATFSSKPIQLAKLVHESSVMFQNGTGEDIAAEEAKSGVQVSCPTRARKGGARAPFCYAIEVGRSPLVNINRERLDVEVKEPLQSDGKKAQKKKAGSDKKSKKGEEKIHGPVAYSLSIHSPLVIANLLPEGGRFELMHAIRKTVVWYADLKPGQQIAVHSVGLDAPLLLLVNLGFCRTPVGEGALVHHGKDSYTARRGEQVKSFKSIGKAALKGTKQIGKTLTAISDSPDRRGQGRLAQVRDPQFYNRQNRKEKIKKPQANQVPHGSLGLDTEAGELEATGGKIHSVESVAYSQSDIATETTVVDGIGQRLTLRLENVRGGGGQRRVSLFCPFWVVNTTEHSLRYKQEKGKSFVSGTVISPEKDGSRPVDGSNRNYRMHHKDQATRRKSSKRQVTLLLPEELESSAMNSKTIFAGTPGALASTPGRCDLDASEMAELIDKELSLERMAQLAFMFNFHEEGLSIGHQMLSVQLFDGSGEWDYSSDWSRGFSLDSVGFSQIVSMNTKEGRAIELSVEVNVAPGVLSSYTKIVRFVPRYVIFNRLERPVRLWQDSSVFRPENEDRTATSDGIEINREARKWRYYYEDKNHEEKINQYETLYGRPSTIKDDLSPRTQIIAEGTTAHRSALYITTIGPSEIAPFLLPDTRAERQLRVDLGGIWNVSSSFASELPGEHSLKVSRATDLRMLNHVSTRAAPKYKIVLPPPEDSGIGEWDGELGVFFETDWGADKRIIVKGTKRGRFAYNHTDIHVGDELLRIDGISVAKMSFAETMKLIKERVTVVRSLNSQQNADNVRRRGRLRRPSIGTKRRNSASQFSADDDGDVKRTELTLTFRTLEERLRKLRGKASHEELNGRREAERDSVNHITDPRMEQDAQLETFNVEMKSLHNTMFVILHEPDKENPPFQIQNRSINHVVFYRQRGCEGHPWNIVFPGESIPYSWEEPMRSKKLTVRVAAKSQEVFKVNNGDASSQGSIPEFELEQDLDGEPVSSPEHEQRAARVARLRQALAYQFVNTEERGGYGPSITVRLEEIGYRTFLPILSKDGTNSRQKFLNCEVDTDGGTRLLVVSDDAGSDDERSLLKGHLDTLRKQVSYEEQRTAGLSSLQYLLSKEATENANGKKEDRKERIEVIEGDARRFVEDFPEDTTVSRCHQVVVEVIEAVGLNVSDFVGNCNPYCEIFLKGRSKSRQYFFQKRRNKRKTYFIEKSLSPKWTDQTFIFDVPEEAVRVTRGHHLLVKVRNFRLVGQHPILGQAAVHFGSLRNQQELVGWYPLAGRTGRSDVETVQLSDASRGSIRLRVHWVYTTSALIDYFLMLSQARLSQLSKSRDGMMEQLSHAIDSDERKRESKESVNAGRIKKLAKLEKKTTQKMKKSRKRNKKRDQEKDNVVGKLNQGINSSLTVLKGTLKASRDRYLYALYYQTAESKRNRQIEEERQSIANQDESVGASTSVSDQVGATSDPKSPGSLNDQQEDQKKSLEQYLTKQRGVATMQSPQMHEAFQKNRNTLDEFFAGKSPRITKSPFPSGKARVRLDSAGSPRRASRRFMDSEIGRHLVSHRRLSMDIDDPLGKEESVDHGENWRSAMLDSVYGQSADWGISDLVSVGTDVDEGTRERNTRILMKLGFLYHEFGVYFHENHLPHNFRRSLFGSSTEERRVTRLYRPKLVVGTPSEIRHFKTWQAAGAIHIDPELEVTATDSTFIIQFKEKKTEIPKAQMNGPESKEIIHQRLQVPEVAPLSTKERSIGRVETLYLSRCRFERAAKRTLGAVLNPGGWLTVRPITALNLPDGYNGMFVRVKHGKETLVSETVDAKVTPRWGSLDILDSPGTRSTGTRRSFAPRREQNRNRVKLSENDLHIHVEPQQTSGTIKVSVVAERMNTKTELGVLEIPLGAAIAACLDECEEEIDLDRSTIKLPLYVRWFPLLSPRLAVPVEGDMGISSRSAESEKPRDSMFQQYFAPCIQLALIWWPESTGVDSEQSSDNEEGGNSGALARRGPSSSPRAVVPPAVQSYFNLDLGRVSAALIDSQRAAELLSFTVTDLDARYSVTKTKTRMGMVVGWIQLDHQDPRAREPVVFAPTPTEVIQPTLQLLALKDNLRTKSNIVSYEYIGVALQEMDLTVEESWIFELWDFFMGVMRRRKAKRNTRKGQQRADFLLSTENCFSSNDLEEQKIPSLLSALSGETDGGSPASRRKIYIEQLILGLVKVNLSYVKGKKQSYELTDKGAKALKNLEVRELPNLALAATGAPLAGSAQRGDQSEVFIKWSQHTYDEDLLDNGGYNLPGIIAAVFPSVSDAPIRLQGKVIDHVFESGGEIVSSIKNFYVNETLKQVYKIIGSLDFVGNPTILFSSFVSGVRDLVAAPTSAFLKSPTNMNQVGIAVGKGTLSLFSHSASGIFGFAAKMSATAGQAAAILSLDTEYSQWHRDRIVNEATNLNREWKRRGIQSVPEMLTRPVGDIILGVAMGASGLVISPYKGFKKGGGLGFVRGIAIGTAGVVAKPLVGVLDAFTHFSSTVHDVAKSVNVLERRYQPSLKIRLPYAFGPMNVLSPFDPICSRSVHLLRVFPPKTKRNQKAIRTQEIYVHSEVLHMEPGVDTFAIATTIRVVLIRLRKDATGGLLPALGWEVQLGNQGTVESRVSDHGHNGVALTITRRVADDKAAEEVKDSKIKRSKRAQEAIKTPTFSSALSIDSGFSDLEDDDDIEVNAENLSERGEQAQLQLQGEDPEANEEVDPTFDHGATKKGDEVVKWFTVLAEYQHRRQLTTLHNAVSALVGNFEAIVSDHAVELKDGKEGVTTFGIFNFEKSSDDPLSVYASNAELIDSLENLPWVHEGVFARFESSSGRKKKESLASLHQNWSLASALEGSKKEGGPAWLVEARARAMFPASESPAYLDFLDPDDPVVREVMFEHKGLNTPRSEGLASVLPNENEEDEESDFDAEGSFSIKGLEADTNVGDSKTSSRKEKTTGSLTGEAISSAEEARLRARVDSEDELFHSMELQGSFSNWKESENSGSRNRSGDTSFAMHSASSFENHGTGSVSGHHGSVSSVVAPPVSVDNATNQGRVARKTKEASRMDKMESLMEQLVIINAQQVQKQSVPLEIAGDGHSLAESRVADMLKQEVAELRSQVQARAVEDDALRNEITQLRQKLAERREQRAAKSQERPRLKIPEILRFGVGSKKEEDSHVVDGKEFEMYDASADLSTSIIETPLKDGSQEHRGSMKKAARRMSGDTFSSAELTPATKRTSTAEARLNTASSKMGRRPSADGGDSSRILRRSSIGSEVRASGRRLSGDHQVRWE